MKAEDWNMKLCFESTVSNIKLRLEWVEGRAVNVYLNDRLFDVLLTPWQMDEDLDLQKAFIHMADAASWFVENNTEAMAHRVAVQDRDAGS